MRMYVRMARATRRASILYPGAVTGTRPGSHGSRGAGRRFWPGSRVAGRRSATPWDPANPVKARAAYWALWVYSMHPDFEGKQQLLMKPVTTRL